MSNLDDIMNELKLRILCYGPAKVRKTWWAGSAAEAGFNTIFLDADDGVHILKNLSPEARKRVHVVNIIDTLKRATCSVFLTKFLVGDKFVWDNKDRKIVKDKTKVNPNNPHFLVDASKLTPNDCIVLDSWTANAHSLFMRYCLENAIDISKAEEGDNRWEGYRYTKAIAEWQLNQLHDLNSQVIVCGHQQVYEKSRDEKDGRGKTRKIVEWSRTQPVSTSGPAAMLLAQHFSDILYFEIAGDLTRINTSPSKHRDGGSRIIPPGQYEFQPPRTDNKILDFAKVCKMAKIALPTDNPVQQAFRYFKAGEEIPFGDTIPTALQANKKIVEASTKPKPASLTALAGAKK